MYVKRFGLNTEGRDIAVGDIHAHFTLLQKELDRIKFNPLVDRLFMVGDLVDKGPENLDAYKWLQYSWVNAVKGNHDGCLARYINAKHWINGGGKWFQRLNSQEQELFAVPFQKLPVAIEVETKYGMVGIVHAACEYDSWEDLVLNLKDDYNRKTHKAVVDKCLYSRTRFEDKDKTRIKDIRAVVVGHNPVDNVLKLGNTYYIDTQGWKPGIGKFTLFNLNGLQAM